MKRLLVVDDERPVIDAIIHHIEHGLDEEFSVVGTASTGREAIERFAEVAPDIVLMDVRMPGISGVEAIRELRRRGATSAFILVTAYERFDIAMEAVELAVAGYLLKPVTRDGLAAILRTAAEQLDRRLSIEGCEAGMRDAEVELGEWAESSFMKGILLGERFGDVGAYRKAMGIEEEFCIVLVMDFALGEGPLLDEQRGIYGKFRDVAKYKVRCSVGPLVAHRAAVLLPLRKADMGEDSVRAFVEAISNGIGYDFFARSARLGRGSVRPLGKADLSWAEAIHDLARNSAAGGGVGLASDQEPAATAGHEEERILAEAMASGDARRMVAAIERIVDSLRSRESIAMSERCRLVTMFGSVYLGLEERALTEPSEIRSLLDMGDLILAADWTELDAAVRLRIGRLIEVISSIPRYTEIVARAIAYIESAYSNPIGLETAAEELGTSAGRLSRLFVEQTGQGFSGWLIGYRIARAKELLARPGASIKEVSASCGYVDPNYFARLFKKETGYTPTAWAATVREEGTARVE
jgi:two-component system response regulator YesN